MVAYGRIIPGRILEALPMVNVHFSLLPRWRGAAPVERAILAGDVETGVCLMGLEAALDTGARSSRPSRVPIGAHEHVAALTGRLAVGRRQPARRRPAPPASTAFRPGRRSEAR